jgi:hypothetical protein
MDWFANLNGKLVLRFFSKLARTTTLHYTETG